MSVLKAVLRIAGPDGKHHNWADVARLSAHNTRAVMPDNADPSRCHLNRYLIGGPDDNVVALGQAMIRERRTSKRKIRSDAVLAVSGIMSASPEFFRPGRASEGGTWEPECLDTWVRDNMAWIINKYGDRVIQAVLHVDEQTPHIHIILVPLDGNGNLNCAALFGGTSHTMSRLQSDYAAAMAHLGLTIEMHQAKAKHHEVTELYSVMANTPTPAMVRPETVIAKHETPGRLAGKTEIEHWGVELLEDYYGQAQALITAQAQKAAWADHLRLEAERKAAYYKDAADKLKAELAANEEAAGSLKRQYQAVTTTLRDLGLGRVLQDFFEAEFAAQDGDHLYYMLPGGPEVCFDGSRWTIQTPDSELASGRGAIDLLMALTDRPFQPVVRDLVEVYGDEAAIGAVNAYTYYTAPTEVDQILDDYSPSDLALRVLEARRLRDRPAPDLVRSGPTAPASLKAMATSPSKPGM